VYGRVSALRVDDGDILVSTSKPEAPSTWFERAFSDSALPLHRVREEAPLVPWLPGGRRSSAGHALRTSDAPNTLA
jgi:hypothetical protein